MYYFCFIVLFYYFIIIIILLLLLFYELNTHKKKKSSFSVETIQLEDKRILVWSIEGFEKIRCLWKHHFTNSSGIIFVIDSTDREKIPLAAKEIRSLMEEPELVNCPLLVLANKQDDQDAMSENEIISKLRLDDFKREWKVQSCSAYTGQGLKQGLDQLDAMLAKESHFFKRNFFV